MKRNFFARALLGAPIGVTISYIITIIISYSFGNGSYLAVVPELAERCGGELNAVTAQAVCSMLYGAVFAGASVIWEKENWSILRQTLTHLAVVSTVSLPVAYLLRWMEHSVRGVVGYFGMFFGIYFIIWLSSWLSMRRKIKSLNQEVGKQ